MTQQAIPGLDPGYRPPPAAVRPSEPPVLIPRRRGPRSRILLEQRSEPCSDCGERNVLERFNRTGIPTAWARVAVCRCRRPAGRSKATSAEADIPGMLAEGILLEP